MTKFNRIGNKLGLAGALAIALSIGMVVTQSASESKISESNQRAEVQQHISDYALKAESEMRNMQLAVRGVRLARSVKEIETRRGEFQTAKLAQQKLLDEALKTAKLPQDKELFTKIKEQTDAYIKGAEEQAVLMYAVLELNGKRIAISTEWDVQFDKAANALSVAAAATREDIETQLRDADAAINALNGAGWRFFATGEAEEKAKIKRNGALLSEALKRTRGLATDPALSDSLQKLEPLASNLLITTEEVLRADELKNEISRARTVPIANGIAQLLRTSVPAAQTAVADARANAAETMSAAGRMALGFGAAVVVVLLGSMAFSFLGVARPLTRLNAALGKMAAGDLAVVIPGADRGDEVGDIAKTVSVIKLNAEQKAREESDAKLAVDELARSHRKADMSRLADEFEGAIGEIVETVSSASTELEASAGTLTATAERSEQLATVVAAASEEASTNVQSVASATEEMSSSVNEISRQVQESARIANEAVDQARNTNDRVGELSQAAGRIGDVVELINTIAGQTNLLALNATIEAARAGEAGRGFAVVASEVKALAEQTAKATGDISQQISGIQAATQASVAAIREISETIGRMSEISSTIASAVEQQGAATQEISRNVQQAAQGTQEVSSNIADVQRGATETGSASTQVLSAAQSLSRDSNRLKLEVSKFLNSVRAA